MAKGLQNVISNLRTERDKVNSVAKNRQGASFARFQNVIGASLVASDVNRKKLVTARKQREDHLQNLNDEYARNTSKVLSKMQLKALIDASNISAPTFTSIYTGYELSRASAAERERARIDLIDKRVQRDSALDAATFNSEQKDLATLRAASETVLNKEQQNISTDTQNQNRFATAEADLFAKEIFNEDSQANQKALQDARIERDEELSASRITSSEKIASDGITSRETIASDKLTASKIRAEIARKTKNKSSKATLYDSFGSVAPSTTTATTSKPNVTPNPSVFNTPQPNIPTVQAETPSSAPVKTVNKPPLSKPIPIEENSPIVINIDETTYNNLADIANSPEFKNAGIDPDKAIKALAQLTNDGTGYGLFGATEKLMTEFDIDVSNMSEEEKHTKGTELSSFLMKKSVQDDATRLKIPLSSDINILPKDERESQIRIQKGNEGAILRNSIKVLGKEYPEIPENLEINRVPDAVPLSKIEDLKNEVIASDIPNNSPEVELAIGQLDDISQPALDEETFKNKYEGIADTLIAAGVEEETANNATFDRLYDDYISSSMGDTSA